MTTVTRPTAPYRSPQPTLLASHARTSRHDLGPCPVCGHQLAAGLRVADRAGDGRPVHVAGCAAKAGKRNKW